MISSSSSTASSAPATSAKVTFGASLLNSFALDLPNCIARPPPWAFMMRNQNRPMKISSGRKDSSRVDHHELVAISSV